MSKNDEFCIQNDENVYQKREFCIQNDENVYQKREFCIQNDENVCRWIHPCYLAVDHRMLYNFYKRVSKKHEFWIFKKRGILHFKPGVV